MQLRSRKLPNAPVVKEYEKESGSVFNRLYEWKPSKDNLGFQFLRESTLHGCKYIGYLNSHLCERIFWIIVLLALLVLSIDSITKVFDKFFNNPIIVSYQPFEISLEQIPFPAITICNVNNIRQHQVDQIVNAYYAAPENSTEKAETQRMIEFIVYACQLFSHSFSTMFNYSPFSLPFKESTFVENFNDTTILHGFSDEAIQNLTQLFMNCSELILLCSWAEVKVPCEDLFRSIETDFGLCCSFNIVPPELLLTRPASADNNLDSETKEKFSSKWADWNIDNDLVLDHNSKGINSEVPIRQRKAGRNAALSILVNPDLNNYFCSPMDSTGFKLIAGSPIDYPSVADYGTIISSDSETFVDIRPELTMADKEIFKLSTKIRNCYYVGEFKLRFYSYYTIGNCRKECKADITIRKCECVQDFQPRNASVNLCGSNSYPCLQKLHKQLLREGMKKHCSHCLPGCTQIQYQYTTSELRMNPSLNPWIKNGTKEPWADNHVSIVHIYFGSDSIYSRLRQRIYDTSSLLANAGGLLGLYFGFSFVSLLEIVYHFFIKLLFERTEDGEYVLLRKWRNRNNNETTLSAVEERKKKDETLKAILVKSKMGKLNEYPWSTGEIIF